MTIFEALRADHQKQRTLVQLVAKTKGDSEGRNELFARLKRELQVHADAEERFFYKQLITTDMTQDHARHGIAEHHEIDELIEELETTDMSSSGWVATAKKLEEKVLHHLKDEEHGYFQLAGKVFTEDQKTELAEKYNKYMEENR